MSLVIVETDEAQGFRRGKKLDKIGLDAQDTSELFFDDVWVPAENLLGMQEGKGFSQLDGRAAARAPADCHRRGHHHGKSAGNRPSNT